MRPARRTTPVAETASVPVVARAAAQTQARTQARRSADSRAKLIAAAQGLMLQRGYAATTIDDICTATGLTRGAVFHHFADKEALCLAAVDAWGAMGMGLYAAAWSDPASDPLDRVHRLLDIMISFTTTRAEPCLCMVGMMSQELALTHPGIRAACARHLSDWTAMVVRLLEDAARVHPPAVRFDAERVAWLLNSVWQGSMLIAKTRQAPDMIVSNLELVRGIIDAVFPRAGVRAVRPRSPSIRAPRETPTRAPRATSTRAPRATAAPRTTP